MEWRPRAPFAFPVLDAEKEKEKSEERETAELIKEHHRAMLREKSVHEFVSLRPDGCPRHVPSSSSVAPSSQFIPNFSETAKIMSSLLAGSLRRRTRPLLSSMHNDHKYNKVRSLMRPANSIGPAAS